MPKTVLRFTPSERWTHNSTMFTFILLLVTGLGLVLFNVQGERGPSEKFLILAHQVVAILFIIVPPLALLLGSGRVWRDNFAQLMGLFSKDGLLWLIKKPFTIIKPSIKLPPDGKFNPGQKVWILAALTSSLVLTLTGVIIWNDPKAILALFVHTAVSFIITPFLVGHIYMALVNRDTRPGVTAIIDGEVDADWAQEHYPLWAEQEAIKRVKSKVS